MRRIFLLLGFLFALGAAALGPSWIKRWVAHSQGGALYIFDTYATYQFNVLKHPTGLAAVLLDNNVYLDIADSSNHEIREFVGGTLSVIAGNGTAGYVDGAASSAQFNYPTGLSGGKGKWVESSSCTTSASTSPQPNYPCFIHINHYYTALYVGDTENYVVRFVCAGDPPSTGSGCNTSKVNTVSTVAGNHIQGFLDGASLSAEFAALGGMSLSSAQVYYIADAQNHSIRGWDKVNVSTFAGTGQAGLANGYRTGAQFDVPSKVTWDSAGNMYVTDTGNDVIRKIDTAGNVTTFAGTGSPGYADGPGSSAQFNMPCSIVFNPADNFLYVGDSGNNMIRRIDLTGNVITYTGAKQGGLVNGSLSQARFQCPMDLVILSGFMYISDAMNNVIRRIDMTTGIVSTYIS